MYSIAKIIALNVFNILPNRKSWRRLAISDLHAHLEKASFTKITFFLLLCLSSITAYPYYFFQQNDSDHTLTASEKQRLIDSVRQAYLKELVISFTPKDGLNKKEVQNPLENTDTTGVDHINSRKAFIDSLRETTKGYPVFGPKNDTIFLIYAKLGASTPKDRAFYVSNKIKALYDDDFFNSDSIIVEHSELSYDIVYGNTIIVSVTEDDALWHETTAMSLANNFKEAITSSIVNLKEERKISKIMVRLALAILVIGIIWLLTRLLKRVHRWSAARIEKKSEKWLKSLNYKDYTFLSAEQELKVILFILKSIRWIILFSVLYIALPIVFSIFPISRHWADVLFNLVWSPLRTIFISVWEYFPKLFKIFVIIFVIRYIIKFIRYFFQEIESEKLKISGFYPDWAPPTFSIIKFLLYAFTFVLIFPLLPGSDSHIFKGVSVFVGVLLSLGSSTALSNMIAGLIINYMRPFRIGDHIKIADIKGDVVEKSLLVTRIRTIKNEVITIPNGSILTGNTVNYSTGIHDNGLILHTNVTIGYNVPWSDVHQALIEAASRSEFILKHPKPFVHQTGLDDFYIVYQLNAYTQEASGQAQVYSELHQNIQDVFNERGIEILSPHYRAARDGNESGIPTEYLPKDYKAPSFNIKVNQEPRDPSDQHRAGKPTSYI